MKRYINLMDEKGRDAKLLFAGQSKEKKVFYLSEDGKPTQSLRVLKTTLKGSYSGLLSQYGNNEAIADALVKGNPELDLQRTGMKITETNRLYITSQLKPAHRITIHEIIRDPKGEKKSEREIKEIDSNITDEIPLLMGHKVKKTEMYNKIVFVKKYQLHHVNGLTFEFLYDIAKRLEDEQSLMIVGAGKQGKDPLVFQDGGKKYRGFLEGRTQGSKYLLILHLSNLELKDI
ncbi:MAG: hypothetical protein EBS17_05610 [Flavobacteriia bacterium]|nr:hypothetical protein [Flavobacteriia bacterium]